MNFFRTDLYFQIGLILLVLMALVFTPLVSAGTLDSASVAKNEHREVCAEMHEAEAPAAQQADSSDCCEQNTDCQTHCQNLVLTHLPVSALLTAVSIQFDSSDFILISPPQMLSGIATSLDPRPPQV